MNKHELHDIQRKLGLRIDEVAEALGVELFTVQQWSSGVWPIPRIAAKFLHSLWETKTILDSAIDILEAIRIAHDNGYDRGYKRGIQVGLHITREVV